MRTCRKMPLSSAEVAFQLSRLQTKLRAGRAPHLSPELAGERVLGGSRTHLKHAVSRQGAAAKQSGVKRLLVGHSDQRAAGIAAGAVVGSLQCDLVAPN